MAFLREIRAMLKTPAGAMLGVTFLLMAVSYGFVNLMDYWRSSP